MAISNMLSWGLDFLYKQAEKHTDIDILIGMPDTAKFPLKATMTECRPIFDQTKVKIIGQRFHFMISTVDFEETGLPLVRGLEIETVTDPCRKYELVLDPKGSHFYNDQERRRLVLITTEKEC